MNNTNEVNVTSSNVADDPNTRFSTPKYLGEWNFREDCQRFFEKYNKDNNYAGLSLGDYVKIFARDEDHTYEWMVAGFDYYEESFGPGIIFIPRITIGNSIMNQIDSTKRGYYMSDMDVYLTDLINNDYALLEENIVLTDGEPLIMLMSDIQVYGKSINDFNRSEELEEIYQTDVKFDKGILPIFKYIRPFDYIHLISIDELYRYPSNWNFWLRAVASSAGFAAAYKDGGTGAYSASSSFGLRPLIYLR